MEPKKNLSLSKRLSFARNGVLKAFKRERSLRVQAACALIILIFCVVVRPPAIWCALFVLVSSLVIALELINTAFEAAMDKIHPGRDSEIGFAKDCMAGAVLVASISAVAIFGLYLWTFR